MEAVTDVTAPVGSSLLIVPYFNEIAFTFVNVVWPVFIALGIAANIINIIVFTKMGFHESLTISFWALSVSDLLYLLCSSLTAASTEKSPLGRILPVRASDLTSYLSWYETIFYDTSLGITTYIAVARCCCVAIALRFKNVFTIRRTVVIIFVIFIVNIIFRIPVLMNLTLMWKAGSNNSASILILELGDGWSTAFQIQDILSGTIIRHTASVVVVICMGILIFKLVEASQIRKALIAAPVAKKAPSYFGILAQETDTDARGELPPVSSILGKKEIQAVKAVTLLATICVLTNLTVSMRALADVLEPEFSFTGKYRLVNYICAMVNYSVFHLNAGVTMLIYYSFNSRYRTILSQYFTKGSQERKRIRTT